MDATDDTCVLCNELFVEGKPSVKLREKGSRGINEASIKRGDGISTSPGQSVHIDCRKNYCNPNVIARDSQNTLQSSSSPRILRSTEQFNFRTKCLFCGQFAKLSGKKRGIGVFPVRTLEFQTKLKKVCADRNDEWADSVRSRIETINDLPAADAIYHQSCSVNFRTMKNIPSCFSQENVKRIKQERGRPTDLDLEQGFKHVVKYLEENDDEQLTLKDLVDKMEELCGNECYSAKYMKQRLLEHFGDSIIIAEINGKRNVITLRNTAASILHEFYQKQGEEDSEAEKMNIIKTAAKLIKSDIKTISGDKTKYPSTLDIASVEENNEYLPDSLKALLQNIFSEKKPDVKIASIGQAIIQASRPRALITPLQIGLGVQLHHQYASKFLIDVLYNLGFCVSYTEVQKFEASAAVSKGTDIPGFVPGSFVQYVADNVDHDIRTLDGHGTFHGMGIVACVTPCVPGVSSVNRLNVSKEDIIGAGEIPISSYTKIKPIPIKYDELADLRKVDGSKHLDLLIQLTWPLRPQRPGWSGLMQLLQKGESPGKSSVLFLPMIDLNPSDMSCIYTTLKFVTDHARKYGINPVITFDQPLYWKALAIILNEPEDSDIGRIVLRLGGFHTIMSFLGSIGHLMQGSGLNEVLETVYAPNTVLHMMTGKAVSRAIRGHLLVERALVTLLVSGIFGDVLQIDGDDKSNGPESQEVREDFVDEDSSEHSIPCVTRSSEQLPETEQYIDLGRIYDDVISGKTDVHELHEVSIIETMGKQFSDGVQNLKKYRTASLWLQYIEMINLLQTFIKAERTGDWGLHLSTLSRMLPYFAAAGHNLYLKSAYTYLQSMNRLSETNPEVYKHFQDGHHVVRRSDRFWAGLSTDLVIEQVLMRSVKTTGGMTRGKGMTDVQRAQWLLSIPACADTNRAMQDLSGVSYHTSDQHKEYSESRQQKDGCDTKSILAFLSERNPFAADEALRNIETGVEADISVNVDNAKEIGSNILKTMVGESVIDFTFKRSQQATVLTTKPTIKLGEESIQVDPQHLFQRFITAAQRSEDDISVLFEYELCSMPSALFDKCGLPRQAQKQTLADAIWSLGECGSSPAEIEHVRHVLDGGSLLHRLPWVQGMSFGDICDMYVKYISKKYVDPIIVFDGYESGPSTKDIAHIRRTHGVTGPNVAFNEATPFKGKKDSVLSNSENKQRFLNLLSERLLKAGYQVIHAVDDADVLIVKTAISCSEKSDTVVIGEDTDLLVLLCHHVPLENFNVYFWSEGKNISSKAVKCWDIKKTKVVLGESVCRCLPFLHAITGCDTTSRMFGISKGAALKKMNGDELKECAEVFNSNSSKDDIVKAGENAIVMLYGGVVIEGLDLLRFRKFVHKVTTSSKCVQVHTIPPTSAAAAYHSMRVYYQVQTWTRTSNDLVALDWGWSYDDNKLVPIKTHLAPAPESLLKIIRCSCKTGCDTKRCTCRKNGLDCSLGCGECRGVNCTNVSRAIELDAAEDMIA